MQPMSCLSKRHVIIVRAMRIQSRKSSAFAARSRLFISIITSSTSSAAVSITSLICPGIATAGGAAVVVSVASVAGAEVLNPGPEEKAKLQSGHNHIGNGVRHKALLGCSAY